MSGFPCTPLQQGAQSHAAPVELWSLTGDTSPRQVLTLHYDLSGQPSCVMMYSAGTIQTPWFYCVCGGSRQGIDVREGSKGGTHVSGVLVELYLLFITVDEIFFSPRISNTLMWLIVLGFIDSSCIQS